ncbi:MAG: GTPase Era [Terriglobales bacterium]
MSPAPAPAFRSGFVTLVGRPNTGKSTLLNALLGRRIAAVTPHPQTTRTHLLGILDVAADAATGGGQIVLVDTPGVHRGRGPLSRQLLRSVRNGLEGRDLALLLADVSRPFGAEDELALDLVAPARAGEAALPPVFLVLNKVDLLRQQEDVLPVIARYQERFEFAEVVPISALRRKNLDALARLVLAALPPGPAYFEAGTATDQPEHFLLSEIIREQAMLPTREEVPHTLAVRVEADERRSARGGPIRHLQAALYCERPGQKAILIGQGGAMIRQIGIAARALIEQALGERVHLELHVLVRPGWRENERFVAGLDFRS